MFFAQTVNSVFINIKIIEIGRELTSG